MKDLIAERDKKEKMKHSVVKWWNVHYMTPEELTEEQVREIVPDTPQMKNRSGPAQNFAENTVSEAETNKMNAAQEIIDRLNREAAEDEARKRQEIEQARLVAEAGFNETTGAYSGAYGADGADVMHKEQIDAILSEKDEVLRDLIQRTEEE